MTGTADYILTSSSLCSITITKPRGKTFESGVQAASNDSFACFIREHTVWSVSTQQHHPPLNIANALTKLVIAAHHGINVSMQYFIHHWNNSWGEILDKHCGSDEQGRVFEQLMSMFKFAVCSCQQFC
mmetsp:Transcript_21926/g.26374  ORF Transcript_21926/g.26374 Transcript_21926/m.26374 type:complete len:128 (+) Transcript_21926:221-604(+)